MKTTLGGLTQGDSKGVDENSGDDQGHLVDQLLPQTIILFRPSNEDRGQKPTQN